MDLNWLEDFLALAQRLNFTRAADARNVTQSAFSRRIQALEDWIGVPLAVRSPRGVALTAAGEYLRAEAAALTRDLHQMRRGALKAAERGGAALAIAATHALSFTFFPGWIRAHAPLETLGTLNLVSDTMAACERLLLEAEVDFLLCHHHPAARWLFSSDSFTSVVVGTDLLVPVAAPGADGVARWLVPGTASQPTRHLAYSPPSGLGRILGAVGRASAEELGLRTVFTSPLAAALQTMARQGQGVAWIPLSLARDDLASGTLVEAGATRHSVPVQVRLFRAVRGQSPAAERFWRAVSARPGEADEPAAHPDRGAR